jgi:hypothetical protein
MGNDLELRNTSALVANIKEVTKEDASFVPMLMYCWLKFGAPGEQPLDKKFYNAGAGERPPEREEFGELDETKWRKLDGKPQDPWVLQAQLPFEDEVTGKPYLFITQSKYGRAEVADVCQTWARRIDRNGGFPLPVVELQTVKKTSKKYRNTDAPSLPIVRWIDTDDVLTSPHMSENPGDGLSDTL